MTTTDRPAHRDEPAGPTTGPAHWGQLPADPAPPAAASPAATSLTFSSSRPGQVVSQTGGPDGAGWYPPSDPPSTSRIGAGAEARDRPVNLSRDRGRDGGHGAAPIAAGRRPRPTDTAPTARTDPMPLPPTAYGYVSVHPRHHHDDVEQELRSTVERLAGFAAQQGLLLAGTFSDVRGQTESGLYHLLTALRQDDVAAVLVPDLEHLQHTGCLAGADIRTATRYLRARVLPLAPATGQTAHAATHTPGGPTPDGPVAAGPGRHLAGGAVRP